MDSTEKRRLSEQIAAAVESRLGRDADGLHGMIAQEVEAALTGRQAEDTLAHALRTGEPEIERIVVTAHGKNRPGVVARVASAIDEFHGDIRDISQTIVADYFTMILVDSALEKDARENRPVRVTMVGAGFMGRGIARQIAHYSRGIELSENAFSFANGPSAYGLLLKDADDVFIVGNRFVHNATGLFFDGAPQSRDGRVDVHGNLIAPFKDGKVHKVRVVMG